MHMANHTDILIVQSLHLSGDQQKAHMAQHTELAHENPPCDLPGADGARDRWHTSCNYPPYSELTQLTGTD